METHAPCSIQPTPAAYALYSRNKIRLLLFLIEEKTVKEMAGIKAVTEKTVYEEIQEMMHQINCHNQANFIMECFKQKLLIQICEK